MAKPHAFSDDEVLRILDLRDALGMTASQIAKVMTRRMGREVTRNSIIGVFHRVRTSEALCGPPESPHDGTWPRGEWADARAAALESMGEDA